MTYSHSKDRLAPTYEEIIAMREVATGKRPADLAIRGGNVLHVHTGEISKCDVLLVGRHIAAVTPPDRLEANEEIDATGKYIAPNFIEAHFHIEYSMLTPGHLARLSVPKGTTTLLADPNCIANVLGLEGIDYIRKTDTPLRIFLQGTSQAPRTPDLELGGGVLTTEDIAWLMNQPYVVSLGESNPFTLDTLAAKALASALEAGKRANGHTARLKDTPLWGYLAGGICDDHNAATLDEVKELIRLGSSIAIQSGSMSNYLKDILGDPSALGSAAHHLFFCADDKHVEDLAEEGHIDHHVRTAIDLGIDPVLAIRMASLNPAAHFRIDHLIGSITPSHLADFMILPDLKSIEPISVFVNGKEVARGGEPLFENKDEIPELVRETIHLGDSFSKEALSLFAPSNQDKAQVRIAELYNGYYKRLVVEELEVVEGKVVADPKRDIAKIAVIDRHLGTGTAGVAFVRGFGLQRGAIAATNNCENQNLVVVGTSDEDMMAAVNVIKEMGGGYVVIEDGKVVDKLPLSVAGLMSEHPWEIVNEQLKVMNKAAQTLGCPIASPFMIIAFVGLAGVPELGLTEKGLIEVETQQFIEVIV